jgi:hypothetical protein
MIGDVVGTAGEAGDQRTEDSDQYCKLAANSVKHISVKLFWAHVRAHLFCWRNIFKGWLIMIDGRPDEDGRCITTEISVISEDGVIQRCFYHR